MGTTMRLGHTIRSARVSLRKGSSQRRTALAVYALPKALPKSSLNLICGGFLQHVKVVFQRLLLCVRLLLWAVFECATSVDMQSEGV